MNTNNDNRASRPSAISGPQMSLLASVAIFVGGMAGFVSFSLAVATIAGA